MGCFLWFSRLSRFRTVWQMLYGAVHHSDKGREAIDYFGFQIMFSVSPSEVFTNCMTKRLDFFEDVGINRASERLSAIEFWNYVHK
jgi:hypothetical protein